MTAVANHITSVSVADSVLPSSLPKSTDPKYDDYAYASASAATTATSLHSSQLKHQGKVSSAIAGLEHDVKSSAAIARGKHNVKAASATDSIIHNTKVSADIGTSKHDVKNTSKKTHSLSDDSSLEQLNQDGTELLQIETPMVITPALVNIKQGDSHTRVIVEKGSVELNPTTLELLKQSHPHHIDKDVAANNIGQVAKSVQTVALANLLGGIEMPSDKQVIVDKLISQHLATKMSSAVASPKLSSELLLSTTDKTVLLATDDSVGLKNVVNAKHNVPFIPLQIPVNPAMGKALKLNSIQSNLNENQLVDSALKSVSKSKSGLVSSSILGTSITSIASSHNAPSTTVTMPVSLNLAKPNHVLAPKTLVDIDSNAQSVLSQTVASATNNSAAHFNWSLHLQPLVAGRTVSHTLIPQLAQQLQFSIEHHAKSAEIRLDPPDLGKLNLQFKYDGDKLHIQIEVANHGIKDVLAQGLERLRQDVSLHHQGGLQISLSSKGESSSQQGNKQQQQPQSSVMVRSNDDSNDSVEHNKQSLRHNIDLLA